MAITNYPDWALNNVINSRGVPNKEPPDAGLVSEGYDPTASVTAEHLNWQFNAIGLAIRELETIVAASVELIYPVGSVIEVYGDSVNPGTRTGWTGTTWVAFAVGRVTVGAQDGSAVTIGGQSLDCNGGSGTAATYPTGANTGGEFRHTLTIDEMPPHNHPLKDGSGGSSTNSITGGGGTPNLSGQNTGTTFVTDSSNLDLLMDKVGGGQVHNNLQPYITVYKWLRTA